MLISQSQPKTPIFTCPSCNGAGQVGARPCYNCQGRGLYFWSAGQLFYWDKELSRRHIWQTRLNKGLNVIFFLILFLFGLWGLYSLASFLNDAYRAGFLKKFFSLKDSRLLLFWSSMWTNSYVYSRLLRIAAENKILPLPVSLPSLKSPTSWEEITQIPKKFKKEISNCFSPEVHSLILKSWQIAKNLHHHEVEPLHLLAASLSFRKTANIFGRSGLLLKTLKEKISSAAAVFYADVTTKKDPYLSLNSKKVFFKAYLIARDKRKKQADLFDLLIAINNFPSPAREVLYSLEIEKDELKNIALWVETVDRIRKEIKEFGFLSRFKPRSSMNRAMTASATPLLNRFSSDLTLLAQKGFLTPCVARDQEIAQIFNIAETQKNGVLLLGNPGTGRRTIVGGIARRMVMEEVPKIFKDKRLVKLGLSALVSGGAQTGTAEQRISAALSEALHSGNIILFIADIHNMIGIQTTPGQFDISEILASRLPHSNLFLLATSNPQEYHKYLEGTALDEVLEKINIPEPQGNQLLQILEINTIPLENKHNVFFSYDAVVAAAKLSDRYLHEKYQPQKALALLEQAAVGVRRSRGQATIIQKEDLAQVVSELTKIPLTQVTEKESEKLLHLEERLHEKMINQEPAVKAVANALRRARAELRDLGRPIANFLFLGPTGVGKTQLAKVVAETYFGSAKNMLRLDMSEYQDETSLPRLIGSIKQGTPGHLTEAVRHNPFSLLLLDELEKAHPEILNLFLQVMDDARLTDSQGRTIDFTNAILIATSNAGGQYIYEAIQKGLDYETIKTNLINNQLKASYRPEFLNRFDEIIVFKPLSQSDLNQITILLLAEVVRQMEAKGIKLEFTEPAVIELARAGFDPEFGARPLRRVIQEKVTNVLAKYLIQGQLDRRDSIIYDLGGKITVKKARRL